MDDLQLFFDNLVDVTEPICQAIDSAKADMTIFDSSGIEAFVTENNPKYANRIIKQLYINGHFCYVFKLGIVTNGLGIIRHISFYNKDFMESHPDILVEKKQILLTKTSESMMQNCLFQHSRIFSQSIHLLIPKPFSVMLRLIQFCCTENFSLEILLVTIYIFPKLIFL